MRIDARAIECHDWTVWHVPRCCELRAVVWVDDVTHEYGQWSGGPYPHIETHRARKISILLVRKLVLIDPIDDDEDQSIPVLTDLVTEAT